MANELRGSADEIIMRVREEAGPEMVVSRRSSEADARDLLDRASGRMSAQQVHELARILNRGSWGGVVKHNRFLPGFSVPLVDQMVSDPDTFNELTMALWRGTDEEALAAADRILRDRATLPGSGQSYPTALLYLREPTRFAVWFDALDRGLATVSDYETQTRHGGSEAYLRFCAAVQRFASDHGLEPQELDAVLSAVSKAQTTRRIEERRLGETPTLTRDAFEFLTDLSRNNNRDWFDANRRRYERDLRDPLTAVLQVVADRYIVSLDPSINTEVKRDAVLARMNKWTQGDPYYTYLWGAFSRQKKQEDVQLYVNVHDEYLEYGLVLGAAAPDARSRLADGMREHGRGILDAVLADVEGLKVYIEHNEADNATIDELAAAAARGDLRVLKTLRPDDELIGSPQLADDIGHVLEGVYPLAALAWGESVEVEPPVDEPVRPEYTLEQLAKDTLLPLDQLEEWIGLLRGNKRAALFYGPPGTGKTYVVEKLARYLAGTDGETKTVQFHPSFSYEDFMEGLRPEMKDGQLGYTIRPGVFHEFCEAARGKDGDYVFVIDEINRAELGSVLGEVMMLIEYRDRAIPLPYSQRSFSIPRNVVLLATMNTADRSLALVDFALRRRFHAFRMLPDREVLQAFLGEDADLATRMFDVVGRAVSDDDYSPGHAYWMLDDPSPVGLAQLWRYELLPYLSEYWFENKARLDKLHREVVALLAEGA